jgi:hypothetical protein
MTFPQFLLTQTYPITRAGCPSEAYALKPFTTVKLHGKLERFSQPPISTPGANIIKLNRN